MNTRRLTGLGIAIAVVGAIMLLLGLLAPGISTFAYYIWGVFSVAMLIIIGASYLPKRVLNLITRLCIAGIMLGILGMIQPFTFTLFKPGFLLLLGSTAFYIILSYVPTLPSAAANPDVVEEFPVSIGVLGGGSDIGATTSG